MFRVYTLLLSLTVFAAPAHALPRIDLGIRSIEHPMFQVSELAMSLDGEDLVLEASQAEVAGQQVKDLRIRCRQWRMGSGVSCQRGEFRLHLRDFGEVSGQLSVEFRSAEYAWLHASGANLGGFRLRLARKGQHTEAQLQLPAMPAPEALRVATLLDLKLPFQVDGQLRLNLDAESRGSEWTADFDGAVETLSFSEASGRFASDSLGLRFDGEATYGAERRVKLNLETTTGQVYVEPVFLDLAASPLALELEATQTSNGWQLGADLRQEQTLHARFDGILDRSGRARNGVLSAQAQTLEPVFAQFVQPFLIGTPLQQLQLTGRAEARLKLRLGAPASLSARLHALSLADPGLSIELRDLDGELHWYADGEAPPSVLDWSGGRVQEIPFERSHLSFAATPRGLRLLEPWRQPLLDGALLVRRFTVRHADTTTPTAELDAELEPIDLQQLCRALGWPEFRGRLGGRLPGLNVDNNIWTLDGQLQAQAFDGSLTLSGLRVVDPFGVVPSVDAGISLRQIDLALLTQAFSFGRIEGRIDGDIDGLRLLNWRPVAMDAHLYSSPGGGYTRRISQRAIDHISAIGGGPTGLLSRGVLGFFNDFAYAEIGWRCSLDNGICRMGGVGPAEDDGFYIVRGRLLPRIDVIGHNRRVAWDRLLHQIEAALAADAPDIE